MVTNAIFLRFFFGVSSPKNVPLDLKKPIFFNESAKYSNIFSYEIESISNSLLKSEKEPKYPAINRKDTELNMNILNKWLKINEE